MLFLLIKAVELTVAKLKFKGSTVVVELFWDSDFKDTPDPKFCVLDAVDERVFCPFATVLELVESNKIELTITVCIADIPQRTTRRATRWKLCAKFGSVQRIFWIQRRVLLGDIASDSLNCVAGTPGWAADNSLMVR